MDFHVGLDAILSLLVLAQSEEAAAPSPTLLDHIRAGGPIGYIIIALSFVALALIVAHLVQIRESRLAPPESLDRLHQLLRAGDVRGAIEYSRAEENDSFLTRVVGSALVRCSRSPFGFLELKAATEEAGEAEVAKLYRSTDGIGLIAAVAPMLGLLGTVVGMVGAFHTVGTSEGFAKPYQLAGHISTALVTTVQGLIVAIPCTAVYTYFRNRIDRVTGEAGELIEHLLVDLEASAQATPAGPAGAPGARPAHGGAPGAPMRPLPSGALGPTGRSATGARSA